MYFQREDILRHSIIFDSFLKKISFRIGDLLGYFVTFYLSSSEGFAFFKYLPRFEDCLQTCLRRLLIFGRSFKDSMNFTLFFQKIPHFEELLDIDLSSDLTEA